MRAIVQDRCGSIDNPRLREVPTPVPREDEVLVQVRAAPGTRFRLLWVVIGPCVSALALVTGQALAGQSIVRPDMLVTGIAVLLLAGAVLAAAQILRGAAHPRGGTPSCT